MARRSGRLLRRAAARDAARAGPGPVHPPVRAAASIASRPSSTASRWISATRRYETFADLYQVLHPGRVRRRPRLPGDLRLYAIPARGSTPIDLGVALQLTNILRDVPEDLRRGRVYIPQEDLRAHDVTEADLRKESDDPRGAVQSAKGEGAAAAAGRPRPGVLRARRSRAAARGRAAARRGRDHGRRLPRDPRSHRAARLRRLLVRRPRAPAAARAHRRDDLGGGHCWRTMTAAMAPDVVVVGAGFAGLSAAALLAEAGRRVLVLDARPQLGGRATAFIDRAHRRARGQRPARAVRLLSRDVRFPAPRRCRRQRPRAVVDDDSVPGPPEAGDRSCDVRRCRRRCTCWRLFSTGTRSDWRDRLSVLKMARPILAARKAIARDRSADLDRECADGLALARAGGSETSGFGNGSGIRWRSRRSTSHRTKRRRPRSSACWRSCSGRKRPTPRSSLPTRPLHLAYAEPARDRHHPARRGGADRSAARVSPTGTSGQLQVDVRGERVAVCAGHLRGTVVRARRAVRPGDRLSRLAP